MSNMDRFTGSAEIYQKARPTMPLYTIEAIKRYLGRKPDTVVDLGCGTGLSTYIWQGHCNRIIGIDPNEDMLAIAKARSGGDVVFIKAVSEQTGIEDNCVDAVVCSQSFHWMEPEATLKEVNRILKNGGVFASVDCDWPPVADWRAELEFYRLFEKVYKIEYTLPELRSNFTFWDKNKQLAYLKSSGYFRFAREIVFSYRESCTAERFINLALSQSSLQNTLKHDEGIISHDLEAFMQKINEIFRQKEFDIDFCYRLRIAVK